MGSGSRKKGTSFHIVKQEIIKKKNQNLKKKKKAELFVVKYAVSSFS